MLLPTMDKNPRIEPSFHELGAAMHANTDGHVFLSFVVIRDGYLENTSTLLEKYLIVES